jgi:hypothetical protein
MVIEARSRIDTWQQQFLRRRARSVTVVGSDSRHTCGYTRSFMQIDKPMHIIGQSRIDTWQVPRAPPQASANRIIHRPIQIQGRSRIDTWHTSATQRPREKHILVHRPMQVEGRSRVDTWQTDAVYRKRRRSRSPVRAIASALVTHPSLSFRSTDPFTSTVEVASTRGNRTQAAFDAREVSLTSNEHPSTCNRKRASIHG